jgi:hypothetical protein
MQATFEVKPFQCRVLQPDRAAQSEIDQHRWEDQNTNRWQERWIKRPVLKSKFLA